MLKQAHRQPSGAAQAIEETLRRAACVSMFNAAASGKSREPQGDGVGLSGSRECENRGVDDHWDDQEPGRQNLGCLLVGWNLQSAAGDRTDHLPALHTTTG